MAIHLSTDQCHSRLTFHLAQIWPHKHETKVKAGSVDGHIAEVKQSRQWTILRWVTIWRFIFFPDFIDFAK